MSDSVMGELKRQAASGDTEAAKRLHRMQDRPYGVRTIFDGAEVGEWIHCEGPSFSDVGILREVFIDELGRAVAVLDNTHRRNDETREGGPTFYLATGNGLYYPSTSVNTVQRCVDRWPNKFDPSKLL